MNIKMPWEDPHPEIVTIRDNKDFLGCYYMPSMPVLQGGGSS